MGYGDEILAAGQAQRYYDADPSRRVAICDLAGRVRWHDIWDGNPILARPDDVARGEPVARIVNAANARPYIVYPFTAHTGWTFNTAFQAQQHVARIYLTAAERARGEEARARYGPYVLIEPWSKHDNLRWPFDHWVQLVASCPDLMFLQHTHKDSDSSRVPGTRYEAATFREACGLLASASLYVRGESGLCHAAAALGVYQVTIWGGCMDWDVLGGYPRQVGVGISRPFCGSWKPCEHCRLTMAGISVDAVRTALYAQLARQREAA